MYTTARIVTLVLVAAVLLGHAVAHLQRPEPFFDSRLYLAGPTKCFSCERDMINRAGPDWAWLGKQTKCFDCEKQLASADPNLANLTHGTKCLDCERELAAVPKRA